MRETEAIIERAWQVAPGVQRIELSVDQSLAQIAPGQSVLAMVSHTWIPYLREKWIPVEAEPGLLVVERITDAHYAPGQIVSLIGPVGTPLPWISGGQHLLLIAQDTVPTSLLYLARKAVETASEVALVLLGEATHYPYAGIPPAVEVITGEHDWPDQDETLRWADQVFAVVSEAFWQDYFSTLYHAARGVYGGKLPVNFFYGVFDMALPCGTGACMACMIRCKTNSKFLCSEGPALDLTEVMLV